MSLMYAFLNQKGGAWNSTTWKLFMRACCAALGAFVFGLCLICVTIKRFNDVNVMGTVLSGAFLILVLLWTRRAVRRIATSEIARKHATQFLWSCTFFSMLSFMLAMAVMGYVLLGPDLLRRFNLVFYSAIVGVAFYPVVRDAKRLGDAVGPPAK